MTTPPTTGPDSNAREVLIAARGPWLRGGVEVGAVDGYRRLDALEAGIR